MFSLYTKSRFSKSTENNGFSMEKWEKTEKSERGLHYEGPDM